MKVLEALLCVLWAAYTVRAEGFYIDPSMADGEYQIELPDHDDELYEPLIKRWEPLQKRWTPMENPPPPPPPPPPALEKRWGTGQMTFVYNEETGEVEDVGLDTYHKGELPLPGPEVTCHQDNHYPTLFDNMNKGDHYASKQAFFNWCDLYPFHKGHVELSLKGSVAVYVCAKKVVFQGVNDCSEGEYKAAELLMNSTCGEHKASNVRIKAWNKQYGRSFKGSQICGWNGNHKARPGTLEFKFKDEVKYRIDPEDAMKNYSNPMSINEGGIITPGTPLSPPLPFQKRSVVCPLEDFLAEDPLAIPATGWRSKIKQWRQGKCKDRDDRKAMEEYTAWLKEEKEWKEEIDLEKKEWDRVVDGWKEEQRKQREEDLKAAAEKARLEEEKKEEQRRLREKWEYQRKVMDGELKPGVDTS